MGCRDDGLLLVSITCTIYIVFAIVTCVYLARLFKLVVPRQPHLESTLKPEIKSVHVTVS
jgi:hypothetical protein